MVTIAQLLDGMDAPRVAVKGRGTIRRGATGPDAKRIPHWSWEFAPRSLGASLERTYLGSIAAIDDFTDRATEIRSGGKFTEQGAIQEVGQYALKKAMPALHRSREMVRKARVEIAAKRAKIKLPDHDKTDSVGYLRRLEIRGHLAGMKDEARKQFISQNRDKLDPEWIRAICEMPPIMSGVLETDHKYFLERELRALHGAAVDEVANLELALEAASGVTELARKEICSDLGVLPGAPSAMPNMPAPRDMTKPFDPAPSQFGKATALYQSQFDELADLYELPHDAPWIKAEKAYDGSEVVRVFKPGAHGGSWTVANEDETERGIQYKSLEDYQKRIAA